MDTGTFLVNHRTSNGPYRMLRAWATWPDHSPRQARITAPQRQSQRKRLEGPAAVLTTIVNGPLGRSNLPNGSTSGLQLRHELRPRT